MKPAPHSALSGNTRLQDIERSIFVRTHFEDGLWDVYLAACLLQFPLAPLLARTRLGDFWSAVLFLPFMALAFAVVYIVRRRVVAPRVGDVVFGERRRKRLLRGNWVLFMVGVIGLCLAILSFVDFGGSAWIHTARFGLVVLVGATLGAYVFDYRRLYIYGLLMAVSPVLGAWLSLNTGIRHGIPLAFGVTMLIILITGMTCFVRFLGRNPLPEMQHHAEEGLT